MIKELCEMMLSAFHPVCSLSKQPLLELGGVIIINTQSERSRDAGDACRSETIYNLDLTTGGLIVDKSVRARSSMSRSSCAALSAMRNLDEPTATVGGRIAGT